MKAVMYHYVRGETERPPSYYHLAADDFRRQLDYFEREFGFVSCEEFVSFVRGDRDSAPSGVLLTFDDGLRDHYDCVFPELRKRGLWGIFYVPVGPYETGRLLDVHRVHSLLGKVGGEELLSTVREIISEEMIPHRKRDSFREETYQPQKDAAATKRAKRILNYYVADQHQTQLIDETVAALDVELPSTEQYYVRPDDIREMHENGMTIGGHTVSHPVLSKLNEADQRKEIQETFDMLDSFVDGLSERTFCYPYGGESSFTDATVSILEDVNCEWCFKVDPEDFEGCDLHRRPQTLPRYDCNSFPHGEASGVI